MSNPVSELKSLLQDQPANPLRPHQVAEYQEERQRLQSIAKAPAWVEGADRGAAVQVVRRIDKTLTEQAAKPIEEPMRRDQVAKLANEVLRDVIQPMMLTQEEMRRNPAGAVDAFLKGEGSRAGKDAILTWRRAQRAVDPSNEDEDYTNIERFRPVTRAAGPSTFMAEAQIPGNFAMSAQAKHNWPLGEPTVETPLKTAKKRESKMTPEQRAEFGRRMAEARAAKRDTPEPTA